MNALSPLHLQLIIMCFCYIVWEVLILLSLQKAKDKKITVPQSLLINLSRKIYLCFYSKLKQSITILLIKGIMYDIIIVTIHAKKLKILHYIKPCA